VLWIHLVFQLNLDSFCDLINEWIHGMVLIRGGHRSVSEKVGRIFLDRTRVGKVKNFTDFTDRTTLPKSTDTDKSILVLVG
jgi:hypothetical protein